MSKEGALHVHILRHVTSTLRTREQSSSGRHDPLRHAVLGIAILGLAGATSMPALASPAGDVTARETHQTSIPLPTGVVQPTPVEELLVATPSDSLWKHMPAARLIAAGDVTDLSGRDARAAYQAMQGIAEPMAVSPSACFPGLDTEAVAMRLVEPTNGDDPIAIILQQADAPLAAAEERLRDCRFMSIQTEASGIIEIDSVLLPRPMVQADHSLALERMVTRSGDRDAHVILGLAAQAGNTRVIALTVSDASSRPASEPVHAAFLAAIDQLQRTI
ncbi:hypothetical protein [Lolliginicoccus suaedae]|uniref:hypothetical protein n=1 Tax=Lolliginicoccus suaedae TaxID=2605429 RepID=UPI0011F03D81|nr:hypothetical protein [Lolliginicoccus suaedae]